MPPSAVRYETTRHVATITLDRAASGNAIDYTMAVELAEACSRARESDEVRVVVLTGAGAFFCKGDRAPADGKTASGDGRPAEVRVAGRIASVEKPVIAAINGDAIDQGLELALACDIRVASDAARLGLTHSKSGSIPWDGGSQRLPRLVGTGRALEMVLTGRLVGAEEARQMGLVNVTAAPGEAVQKALAIAAGIAEMGPIAARYVKEAVLKGGDMTLDQGLRLEGDLNVLLHTTSDRAEGIRSFVERRKPEYSGE